MSKIHKQIRGKKVQNLKRTKETHPSLTQHFVHVYWASMKILPWVWVWIAESKLVSFFILVKCKGKWQNIVVAVLRWLVVIHIGAGYSLPADKSVNEVNSHKLSWSRISWNLSRQPILLFWKYRITILAERKTLLLASYPAWRDSWSCSG